LVDGGIRVFTQIEWQLTYPIASAFDKSSFWTFIKKKKVEAQEQFSSKKYPYAAKVTEGTRLSVGEEDYLKARTPKVKRALESLLQIQLKDAEVPRIAFCCSGGGYRAMLGALGWFKGSQEIGLLDSMTYGATLSGSSWFLAPWVSSGLTLNSFHQQLLPKLETNLLKTNFNLTELKKLLVTKFIFGEPLSLTDIYGAILAKRLLGGFTKDPQSIVLSEQAERVADGSQIYPLYTAILSEGRQYEWFEFNPHVVGSDYLNAYVPSWAFGRKFNRGVSASYSPPQSLGFLMGIWGWVIGFKAHDVLEHFKDSLRPETLRKAVISSSLARKAKTVPVFNYTYGMSGPYALKETLFLADAGIHFNLPLPLVLKKERKVDIIIMLDTTAVPNLSFKRAVEHAQKAGHKFPTVDYQEVDARNKSCLVFQDNDPSTPTLIYMPLVKNDGYSSTFDPDAIIKQGGYLGTGNLTYTNQQANSVIGLAEYSMKASRDLIANAIKDKIQLKRNVPA
jgi:phospholipase A2